MRAAKFFFLFMILLFSFSSARASLGAESLTLFVDGRGVGEVHSTTINGTRYVLLRDVAEALGFSIKEKNNTIASYGERTSLEFIPGAAAAIIQGQIVALPYQLVKKNGQWWFESSTTLKLFGKFIEADRDKNVTLSWQKNSDSDEAVKKAQATSQKNSEVESKTPQKTGTYGVVSAVRWGNQDFGIRVVLDYEGPVKVGVISGAGRLTLRFDGAVVSGSIGKGPYPELVRMAVSQFGDRAEFSFVHRAEKVERFKLENPPRYVLDFYDPKPIDEEAPKVVEVTQKKPSEKEKEEETSSEPVENFAPKANARPLVIVDAGHGGKDPGAVANGIREKDINLKVAKLLVKYLRSKGVAAELTRGGDYYLKLSERTQIANKKNASVFVSLHCNALPKGRHAKGVEIYLMALPSDKDAMELAKIENRELLNGGLESTEAVDKKTKVLLQILGDMQQNAKIQESTKFAEVLFSKGKTSGLYMRRVAQAPFAVLRGAAMPSVLVEMGYLTEREEALKLKNPSYQQKLATAIGSGIIAFLGK